MKIVECRPALVPLTLTTADCARCCDLAGISTEVEASFGRQRFREKMLITHRGFSGPAILQISSYWKKPEPIAIDLAPGAEVLGELRGSAGGRDLTAAVQAFRRIAPARFAERWMQLHAPSRWTNQSLEHCERLLHNWQIVPEGTEGYSKAEVTAGGVDTGGLSARTMESRTVAGLFFIGEVVDVTGQLGGFNFQWAWASGYCAGQAL
jgi:predicted Rossmann fold flavoprotein